MTFDQIVDYFLPAWVRHHKIHPQYNELRLVVSSLVIGIPLVLLFPMLLIFLHRSLSGYLLNGGMLVVTLLSVKYWGHYRIPMTFTAFFTYFIVYDWIKDSGLIYSTNINMLHIYLLAAIWVDKKYGWYAIFTNLLLLGFIYHQTLQTQLDNIVKPALGGPLYPLVVNCLITVFFGGFLAWQQYDQERDRAKIRSLQDDKITVLDDAVKMRTDQLNSMRETMATDFHDETGNMLSAITRQASLLKLKLGQAHEVKPIVESIIKNSNGLYASSKDFLWHLNHNSDDPKELFDYLTGYGQRYYNQFDIAFSSSSEECQRRQFEPSAALNVIFIFKEAMTNIVKHADATEVLLTMACQSEHIVYILNDNGMWKQADQTNEHYGLTNMERRCKRNKFGFALIKTNSGTQVEITVPALNLNQTS
jgi:signal transduction histidine kinase